jgi:hypothetical protein
LEWRVLPLLLRVSPLPRYLLPLLGNLGLGSAGLFGGGYVLREALGTVRKLL